MRRVVLLVCLVGCKKVEPAPTDLNGVLHALWAGYEADDDATIEANATVLEQITNEHALLDAAVDGTQERFTADELAVVDLHAPPDDDGSWTLPDPALARPIFMVNRFSCAMDQLERVLIDLDQMGLFGGYDAYSRTYTSSADDYLAGTVPDLTWQAVIQASYPIAGKYEETLDGGVRRVALSAESPFAGPEALLARTWLPFPATNLDGAIDFRQDYQLELYLPWGDGEIIHLYGIWREIGLGALGSMESDAVARVTLNNLATWDDKIEVLCAEGRP